MTMNLLWYVLAGVLLGFAASTLWEWLYFRNKRMKLENGRVEELEAQLAEEQALNEQMRLAKDAVASQPPSDYASPGVFLDSESEPAQPDGATAAVTAAQYAVPPAPQTAPLAADAVAPVVNTQAPPQSPGDVGASQPAMSTEMSAPTQDARGLAIAAAAVAAGADAAPDATSEVDPNTGAYVDALADVDEYGDDATTLERLAAELAQDPAEIATLPVPDPSATYAVRSTDHPDNLSLIKGIGDVYKFRLYAAGIFTWHQVAESDIETLRVATNAYPGSNVEEWGPQAHALAEKHGRQGAFYTGPVPNDLTQIIGIGPVGERTLFHAGICTYAQLAGTAITELQELFPIAIAGDEPDFAQWTKLAIELANRKDRE